SRPFFHGTGATGSGRAPGAGSSRRTCRSPRRSARGPRAWKPFSKRLFLFLGAGGARLGRRRRRGLLPEHLLHVGRLGGGQGAPHTSPGGAAGGRGGRRPGGTRARRE